MVIFPFSERMGRRESQGSRIGPASHYQMRGEAKARQAGGKKRPATWIPREKPMF
jgi:hypothetical protein